MKGNFTGKFIIDELKKRSEQNPVYREYGYFMATGNMGNRLFQQIKFIDDNLYVFCFEKNQPLGIKIDIEKEYEVNFAIGE
jgi:hypothetical protein